MGQLDDNKISIVIILMVIFFIRPGQSLLLFYTSFSLQSLLDEPNPNSPANSLAAQLYQENRREYEKRVAAIVEQSWLNFNDQDESPDIKKEA